MEPIAPVGASLAPTVPARPQASATPISPAGVPSVDQKASERAMKVAREFEAVMLTQSFESMFKGVKAGGLTGGGHAERTWRSFMLQEYGKAVSEAGGVGIAQRAYEDIMRMQGIELPAPTTGRTMR